MNKHPNATVAGSTGLLAVLVAWILGFLGVDLSAEDGAAIATVLASVALALGRNGVVPLCRRFLFGNPPPPPEPEPPAADEPRLLVPEPQPDHPVRRHHP